MRRALILVLLLAGMQLVLPLGSAGAGSRSLLTFGFLILAAYTVGEIVQGMGLPKLVGYLLAGVVFGPEVLGTVAPEGLARLEPVSRLAIALIAFLAGAELRWEEVRERGGTLLRIMTAELLLTFVLLAAAVVALHPLIPPLADGTGAEIAAFALLLASIAIVHSPAVTMALLSETHARGVVARTTLGVVLLADVAVVLLFSGALAVARILASVEGEAGTSLLLLVWEITGALAVGAILGLAVASYLRFVGRELVLFAVLVAFFGLEIARVTHVELLLMLLTAGFVTENLSRHGEALRHAMERSAAPVFVVFFALSGAKIQVAALLPLLPVVLPLVAVRGAGIWAGTRAGAAWAGVSGPERDLPWMGLISQAGVAIGLAAIVAEAYGEMGAYLRTLLLGIVAINETVGPILFRRALVVSGEVRDASGGEERVPAAAAAR